MLTKPFIIKDAIFSNDSSANINGALEEIDHLSEIPALRLNRRKTVSGNRSDTTSRGLRGLIYFEMDADLLWRLRCDSRGMWRHLATWLLLPCAALSDRQGSEPAVAFQFLEAFAATAGRQMLDTAVMGTFPAIHGECSCRLRCMADPACFGYTHHEDLRQCQRIGQIPSWNTTTSTTDSGLAGWNIFRRRGFSTFGEPCETSADCRLLAQNSTCAGGLCDCDTGLQMTSDGLCARTGWMSVPVGKGRLGTSHQLAGPAPANSSSQCETRCKAQRACAGFEYDQPRRTCQLYSPEVKEDEQDTGMAESFLLFRVGDKIINAPEQFLEVNGSFYKMIEGKPYKKKTQECFANDAILYPGKDGNMTISLYDFFFGQPSVTAESCPEHVPGGADNLAMFDHWILTDGTTLSDGDPLWSGNEPDGPEEEHFIMVSRREQKFHNIGAEHPCYSSPSLCLHIGKNLAPASDLLTQTGDDGSADHGKSHSNAGLRTKTVDLGDFYAVTSVLLILQEDRGEDIHVTVATTASPGGAEEKCTVIRRQYQYPGIGRQYSCDEPLIGRFVRLQRLQTPLRFRQLKVMGSTAIRVQ